MIETGIESKEAEKNKFSELADQLTATSDPAERKRIKEALAHCQPKEKRHLPYLSLCKGQGTAKGVVQTGALWCRLAL